MTEPIITAFVLGVFVAAVPLVHLVRVYKSIADELRADVSKKEGGTSP